MPPPTRALVLPLIALNMTGHASVVDAFTAGDLADHRFLPTAIALSPGMTTIRGQSGLSPVPGIADLDDVTVTPLARHRLR